MKQTSKQIWGRPEGGRSMLEMLAVLSIMGVLSLTSLYGYRYFRNKQQADALVHEINLRATNYSTDLVKNPPSTELTPLDTSSFSKDHGYEFQAATIQDQFYIVAGEVPQEICELVLTAQYKVPFQVDTNKHRNINGDEDACDQEMNELTFHFKNDLQGCSDTDCEAAEVCKGGEVYCGLKCYDPESHECLYPRSEICQKSPYPGWDSSPICQVGPDEYVCCSLGEFCRMDSSTAPYNMCARCEEDEKVMPDLSCCAKSDLCGEVCCSNSNYVCKENKYCVREDQWCENTACASDQRCTSEGCCKVYKACQDDTKCCEEGEVCSLDNVCCPEEQESALKCCESGEVGFHNLCCDKATTTPITSLGLDICCPKDRVCRDKQGRTVCSKHPNAATGEGACEAVDCSEGQALCNLTCYDPEEYECLNNGTLCKSQGSGATHTNCGGTCCDNSKATCLNDRTCCPNERLNTAGEEASCCASGTTVVNGACCATARKCVVNGEEVCCPDGNCCEVSPGQFACCGSGTTCLADGSTEGVKACSIPTTCERNSDCLDTQFCKSADDVLYNAAEKKGTCVAIQKNVQTIKLDNLSATFVRSSNGTMNRWSAENFCDAIGMKLVTDDVTCPDGNITEVASGSSPDCGSKTMQQIIGSKFSAWLDIHVKKDKNNVAYVQRLSRPNTNEAGIVWYGSTQKGEALCMPKDFEGSWSCPTTRPYYSPKFSTCVARICSADENGTVVDACPNNEYCHYDTNWSGGTCGDKISHTGVCRPVNEVTADLEFSVTADGNTTNHTWKKSTISMPWLSAQDLCHKLGRQVVTRTQLCGLNSGLGSAPCAEAATYKEVQPKVGRSFWMEEKDLCTAYRHVNGSFEAINKSSTANDLGAVCSDILYEDPCGDTKIFNQDSQSCDQICRTNNDCVGGKYCDLITFTTDNGCYFESGVCRSVVNDRKDYTIAYDDGDYYMTEDWVVSTRKMSWDSAKNFCAAMSRPIVTRESFLSAGNPQKCTTSTRCMTARDIIDNSSSTWWFDEDPTPTDGCKAYQARSSDLGRDVGPSGASRKEKYTALCGPYNQLTQPCDCWDGSCENSCLPKNGMCSYDLTQTPTSLAADCHYTFKNQTQSLNADCHYQIRDTTVSGNVHSVSLTKVKGCASDKYCYLHYSKEDCSTAAGASIGSSKTEDIYGVCINKNQVNTQCHINITTPPTLTKIKGCTSDKYCYLHYSTENCSTAAGASIGSSQAEDIYGVCINKNQVNTQCQISGGDIVMTKNVGCPVGKYCYLNWTEQSCSSTAGASYLGTFYGSCIPNKTNSYTCPF